MDPASLVQNRLHRPLPSLSAWVAHVRAAPMPVLRDTASLVAQWREREDQLDARTLAESLGPDPLMTLNGEHVISRAIDACGGVNAFARLPGLTPTIGWEAAVRSEAA